MYIREITEHYFEAVDVEFKEPEWILLGPAYGTVLDFHNKDTHMSLFTRSGKLSGATENLLSKNNNHMKLYTRELEVRAYNVKTGRYLVDGISRFFWAAIDYEKWDSSLPDDIYGVYPGDSDFVELGVRNLYIKVPDGYSPFINVLSISFLDDKVFLNNTLDISKTGKCKDIKDSATGGLWLCYGYDLAFDFDTFNEELEGEVLESFCEDNDLDIAEIDEDYFADNEDAWRRYDSLLEKIKDDYYDDLFDCHYSMGAYNGFLMEKGAFEGLYTSGYKFYDSEDGRLLYDVKLSQKEVTRVKALETALGEYTGEQSVDDKKVMGLSGRVIRGALLIETKFELQYKDGLIVDDSSIFFDKNIGFITQTPDEQGVEHSNRPLIIVNQLSDGTFDVADIDAVHRVSKETIIEWSKTYRIANAIVENGDIKSIEGAGKSENMILQEQDWLVFASRYKNLEAELDAMLNKISLMGAKKEDFIPTIVNKIKNVIGKRADNSLLDRLAFFRLLYKYDKSAIDFDIYTLQHGENEYLEEVGIEFIPFEFDISKDVRALRDWLDASVNNEPLKPIRLTVDVLDNVICRVE